MDTEDLMSVRDVVRACKRSKETVRRWIWSGKLKARKLGRQLFVERGELDRQTAHLIGEAGVPYTTSGGRKERARFVLKPEP